MTRDEFCKLHWNYYMLLEKDFLSTERYVTFDLGDNNLYDGPECQNPENSLLYSIEYIKQYQAICSEVDVLMKSICAEFGHNANDMRQYTSIILAQWEGIVNQKVRVNDEFEIIPFQNWNVDEYKSPDWWSPYNKVKHERLDHAKDANLKNVINALGGLYILNQYLVKYIADRDNQGKELNDDFVLDVPNDISKLFEMTNWTTVDTVIGRDSYTMSNRDIEKIFRNGGSEQ